MSTYDDPSIAELDNQMKALHAASDADIVKSDRRVANGKARDAATKERIRKAEKNVKELKVAAVAPEILADAQKLEHVQMQLRVAHYNAEIKAAEYKQRDLRRYEAYESESLLKKDNKRLNELNKSLTATLEEKVASEDKALQSENDTLKQELARLRAHLETKTEELEQKDVIIASKDQDLAGLKEDLAAVQITSHNHEGCDAAEEAYRESSEFYMSLNSGLEDKVRVLTAERDDLLCKSKSVTETCQTTLSRCADLEAEVGSLTIERDDLQSKSKSITATYQTALSRCTDIEVELGTVAAERDDLQSKLKAIEDLGVQAGTLATELADFQSKLNSITKTKQDKLTESVPLKCGGTPDCTSRVPHLKSALQSARAEAARAKDWIDLRNQRVTEWAQFSEQQTQGAHDRHSSVGSCTTTHEAPSASSTLVSSTRSPDPKRVVGCRSSSSSGVSESSSASKVV